MLAKKNKRKRFEPAPYIFLTPFFLTYVIFTLFSVVFTLFLGFTDWDGFSKLNIIGIHNFKRMFVDDPRLFITLRNTVILMLMTTPISIFLSLLLSYFLNQKAIRTKHVFRVIYYLPAIMTPVAVGLLWAILFDYQSGIVNSFLLLIGSIKEPIYFMGTPWGARGVLALLMIWQGFGGTVIFISSALTGVPEELLEAATIDGAGPVKSFLKICIPIIKPVIVFIVITSLISGFQMFDAPTLLFSSGPSGGLPYGGPERSSLTMMMNVYDEAFANMHYGYGAALSYGMFMFIAAFSFISMKLMTRGDK
jgi:multiple sugar transport system permease protein/cellobiose transport system permease protein